MESFSHWLSRIQVKTLWDRLLSLFIQVAAIFLFAAPCGPRNLTNYIHIKAHYNWLKHKIQNFTCSRSLTASLTVVTLYSVRFSTYTPFFKSSLSYNRKIRSMTQPKNLQVSICNESWWKLKLTWRLVDEGSRRSVICSLYISRNEHLQLNFSLSSLLLSSS